MTKIYELHWLIPNRVILAHLQQQLQPDAGRAIDAELTEMIRSCDPTGILIMDLRDIGELQNPSLSRLNQVGYRAEPKLQWLITLTDDKLMQFLASTSAQMASKLYHHFSTPRDVLRFLVRNLDHETWASRDRALTAQFLGSLDA